MKAIKIFMIVFVFFPLFSSGAPENNDFYDNSETHVLIGPGIEVLGEVANPGKVDLSRLTVRSVIVREAVFQEGNIAFMGSYRYDGYSLLDILKERYVDKKNKSEFDSVIDLLVGVENEAGERAVLSWGEIFYPASLHRILLATRVSPIIPSKTGEQWPLGKFTRLVCAQDLISERNLEKPVKISVFSPPAPQSDLTAKTRFSATIALMRDNHKIRDIVDIGPGLEKRNYPSVFYGRGRGFHGIEYFNGFPLKSILEKDFEFKPVNIRSGYFVVGAADGYRVALSYSEIFNRNDQTDFLIIDRGNNPEKGRFRIFPAADFFSDRAVFAVAAMVFRILHE